MSLPHQVRPGRRFLFGSVREVAPSVQIAKGPEPLEGLPLVLLARCRKRNGGEGVPSIRVDRGGALGFVGETDEGATFHFPADRKAPKVEEGRRDVEKAPG